MTLLHGDNEDLFLLTQSEMACWRRCKRKWWLTYYRRLKLQERFQKASALSLGSLFHEGMDAIYKGGDWQAIMDEQEQRILAMEEAEDNRAAKYRKQLELVTIMIEGYIEWAEETGADDGLEVVASEVRMEAPFFKHKDIQVNALGKYDLLVRRHAILGFLDHKSAQSLDQWKQRLANREQFRWYAALLDMLGTENEHPTKGWMNVARKVKRTARATPPFYDRYEVPINGHQVANVKIRSKQMAREMIDATIALDNGAKHHEVVYPNPTHTCSWDCEYATVCPMFDDGSRVEAFVEDWYSVGSPLERYEEDTKENHDED